MRPHGEGVGLHGAAEEVVAGALDVEAYVPGARKVDGSLDVARRARVDDVDGVAVAGAGSAGAGHAAVVVEVLPHVAGRVVGVPGRVAEAGDDVFAGEDAVLLEAAVAGRGGGRGLQQAAADLLGEEGPVLGGGPPGLLGDPPAVVLQAGRGAVLAGSGGDFLTGEGEGEGQEGEEGEDSCAHPGWEDGAFLGSALVTWSVVSLAWCRPGSYWVFSRRLDG